MKVLPTFKGFTVDERLREFRRVKYGKRLIFTSFESNQGKRLLSQYRKEQNNDITHKRRA